jgi:hypothetical protein
MLVIGIYIITDSKGVCFGNNSLCTIVNSTVKISNGENSGYNCSNSSI